MGLYSHKKTGLEVDTKAQSVYSWPYTVLYIHEESFKRELQHSIKIGVLQLIGCTEWVSLIFIVPKKDKHVGWISNFRELNQVLKRWAYPLPIIQDIWKKRKGYKFFTKLDISMMYHTFELDELSQELTTIITTYGKFSYCQMGMGLKIEADKCEAIIKEVLWDLDVDVYIDDIAICGNNYDEHMDKVKQVLKWLDENGFRINPLKCEWAVHETDFLRHYLTPQGMKPWKKRVNTILWMS